MIFACLPLLCLFRFVSHYRKNQVIISLQAEENVRGEKKTNADANEVDEELVPQEDISVRFF